MKILPIYSYNHARNFNYKAKQQNSSASEPKRTEKPFFIPYIPFCGSIEPANRLNNSPFLISKYIGEISKARDFHGNKQVVDMSMGNPDLLPPEKAREVLRKKINDIWSHRYNNPKGEGVLFHTAGKWMSERFGVNVDPRSEVMVTSGASDAISTILDAYANPGDEILVPNPGYSLYDDLIVLKDLKKKDYPLDPKKNYQPDFSKMPKGAKIMILNYPHNPTGSFATKKTLEDALKYAKENNTLIIYDMDNSEVSQSGKKPMGILQFKDAKDYAVEVHTMSKAQSMPGLRVAFIVSSKDNVDNAYKAKLLSGSSVYTPVQSAAATALLDEEGYINKVNKIYRSRKNTTIKRLNELGCEAKASSGTYYLWAKIPDGFTSDEFVQYVLNKAYVGFTPGTVFGSNGEGYVRLVMSADEKTINQSFDRIRDAGIRFDVPKWELPKETREEIQSMMNGTYSVTPKWKRDNDSYRVELDKLSDTLSKKYADKEPKFKQFIPKKGLELPWNILKNGQSVYIQDIKNGRSQFAQINDIAAFSNPQDYKNLAEDLKKQWKSEKYPQAEVLAPYKYSKTYPDAYYFVLRSEDDNKIQALANVEIQQDGNLWLRSLNTAPWNQGEKGENRRCGTAVMARAVSFCLETGNNTLKLATDKDSNIEFYKKLGMSEDSIRNIDGKPYTVLKFDKDAMENFLNKYQIDLAF